jgi:hypothetical protein
MLPTQGCSSADAQGIKRRNINWNSTEETETEPRSTMRILNFFFLLDHKTETKSNCMKQKST